MSSPPTPPGPIATTVVDSPDLDLLLDLCWGKADASVPGGWHPVLAHMLDVAAVALELMEAGPDRAKVQALLTIGSGTIAPSQLAWWVALHDLGKITPGFQSFVDGRREILVRAGLPFPVLGRHDPACNHGLAGAWSVEEALAAAGIHGEVASDVARATCGHHGALLPPSDDLLSTGKRPWPQLRQRGASRLFEALGVERYPTLARPSDAWVASFAGFTAVCDWVGSNAEAFPYAPGASANATYLRGARARARAALARFGLMPFLPGATSRTFSDLFPGIPTPRPIQARVDAIAGTSSGPTLIIVEAPTGVGKTEAALAAAEHLLVRQGLDGVFFALPTQATSNQMFGRVERFLGSAWPDQRTNLHLAHGLAHLQEDYANLTLRSVDGADHTDAAVVADGWFRGRKRTLLSPFAVGTVDQAMTAVLQVRHFFVRLHGLAHKVVVIDEVHAYDAYMSRILDQLLQWLRALGCSVVLLSATLPRRRRDDLLLAWGATAPTSTTPYPRVAVADDAGVREEHVPAESRRDVSLTTHGSFQDAVAAISRAVARGGCAAWICNTVASAQRTYLALREAGFGAEELILFHARFPVEDRLRIEAAVLGRLSRSGDRPQRVVVVATQVVEQSLDLDFDVMLSELAPIDLLLQRAGRLHRHERPVRPPGLDRPTLHLLVPTHPDGTPDPGASAWVYAEHTLLRTWWVLRGRFAWRVPDDTDGLIEAVYAEAPPPTSAAAAVQASWLRSAEELRASMALAARKPAHVLVPRPGVGLMDAPLVQHVDAEESPGAHGSVQARTRDIEATVTLVCLRLGEDGSIVPAADDVVPDPRTERALLGRAVTVAQPQWCARLRALPRVSAWRCSSALRDARAVTFDHRGRADVGSHTLRLDPVLGLVLTDLEASR